MRSVKTIQFRNHTLHVGVTEEGVPVVAIKPICENLGLNVGGQQRRIQEQGSGFDWRFVKVLCTNGGRYRMLCLPVSQINYWLQTINQNRVSPESLASIRACLKDRGIETGATASGTDPDTRYYIYFIQNAKGHIKIGITRNLRRRFDLLQNANSENLRLLVCMRGSYKAEQKIHKQFASARIRGEWFRPTEELMAYTKKSAQGRAWLRELKEIERMGHRLLLAATTPWHSQREVTSPFTNH